MLLSLEEYYYTAPFTVSVMSSVFDRVFRNSVMICCLTGIVLCRYQIGGIHSMMDVYVYVYHACILCMIR